LVRPLLVNAGDPRPSNGGAAAASNALGSV